MELIMAIFISKKIVNGESLGEKLSEARREHGIGLDLAAKDLNIAYKYLDALENNALNNLPGPAYLKNFLKRYCEYLHLDFSDCWRLVEAEKCHQLGPIAKRINQKYFWSGPRLIRGLLISLAVLSVLFFLGIKVKDIFAAPRLEIIQPENGLVTEDRRVDIIGRSEPEVELIINNENIFVDDNGEFQTTIDLQKGLNLIKITAKKRYSRVEEVDLRILLKEKGN